MIDMFIFKRAIKKVTSNYNARETLRRLESFLDENSPQLVYWLANLFNGQQNSISYAELEAAALAGYEAQIRQWQQEYAKFVNDKLNPMWLLAIGAGAKQFELKHGKSLDDSDFFVKNWLNNHAGQFITNINAETRQAIKSILYYCQDQQMNPKQIAQAIRPTIGLTQQQAIANLRYKEHVKRTLLKDHPRMSEAKAEERAQRAALKYSSQQQRYRAETIARTELAFAYNRGAHESVRQAVANGLMGRCEKVWETAGTQRTCGRCMELNGKVVGFDDKFFDSKFDLGETPPLHPRCRCVIIYREIEKPMLHSTSNNSKINYQEGDAKINWLKFNEAKRLSDIQYRELRKFANDNKIELSGFKKSDVDVNLIKDAILTLNVLQNKFPKVADERYKLTLILSNTMDADDFAITTKGRLITLNADAYRDTARLAEEYQKLVDEGWFVQGTDYRAIIYHEFGHIVAEAYKINPLEIACEITGLSEKRVLQFVAENLSIYSGNIFDGSEIISEVFADMSTVNPSEFSKKFYAKVMKIVEEGVIDGNKNS